MARGSVLAAGGSAFSLRFTIREPVKALSAGLALVFACVALSACNDVAGAPPSADASAQFAMRDDANIAGATVAIASIDGPPPEVSTRFRQSFDEAAATRRIAVAAPAKARYLVRGYLTASLINERRNAGLSAVVGHDAIERSGATFSTLIAARREIVATHEELGSLKIKVGLGAVMIGNGGQKPDTNPFSLPRASMQAVA